MSTVQIKTELPFNELLKAVEQLSLPDLEQLMSQVMRRFIDNLNERVTDSSTRLCLSNV